jgi:hypothetical protein
MALSAIIALVLTLPLAAQDVYSGSTTALFGAPDPISNQRQATAQLYKTDVDNYLNVNNWSGVKFEKWFGYLHGLYSDSTAKADLGYATKLGGLYLGTRFWGNAFRDTGGQESVRLNPTYDQDTGALTQLVETTSYPNKWRNSQNELDILLGIAGQGIRIGFYESMAFKATDGSSSRTFTKTDAQDGYITYANKTDEYSEYKGFLRPTLQWGTQLTAGSMTIKPRIGAAFNIYMDKLTDNYSSYTTYNGNKTDYLDHNVNGRNSGYMQPIFSVGADFGLPKKETSATTLTIDYLMNLYIYNNDYSGSGFDGKAKGTVSWQGTSGKGTSIGGSWSNTDTTLTFNDSSNVYHRIAPKITFDKAVAEGLKLGFIIQAPVAISTTSSDQYRETKSYSENIYFNAANSADAKSTTDRTVHTPQGLTETTSFTVSPSVMIGTSYVLIPSRFTVNAGVRLDPTVFTNTKTTNSRNGTGTRTTETVKNGDGVTVSKIDRTDYNYVDDVSTVSTSWNHFTGSVGGGFLFSFNENVALDLWANTGAFSADWNLWLEGVNVMLTFKF